MSYTTTTEARDLAGGEDLAQAQLDAAAAVLEEWSGVRYAHAGESAGGVSVTEVFDPQADPVLILRYRPVNTVTTLTLDGGSLLPELGVSIFLDKTEGKLIRLGGWSGALPQGIVVTYTTGGTLAPAPAQWKAAEVALALQTKHNPSALGGESLAGHSVTYDNIAVVMERYQIPRRLVFA